MLVLNNKMCPCVGYILKTFEILIYKTSFIISIKMFLIDKNNYKKEELHKSVLVFSLDDDDDDDVYDFAQRNPKFEALLSAVFLSRAEHLYL